MAKIDVRKGMPSAQIDKAEFTKRMREQFYDPAKKSDRRSTRSSMSPGKPMTSIARARAPGRLVPAMPIRAMSCRSNGSRPNAASKRRSSGRKTRNRRHASW